MSSTTTLADLRCQIDAIDVELQRLLNERARAALTVAEVKLAAAEAGVGKEADPQFYRPEREAQVLRAVMERNDGPLADETIARLFREIISSCMALEQTLKIGYIGSADGLGHAAAVKHFGQSACRQHYPDTAAAHAAVAAGDADYALLALSDLPMLTVDSAAPPLLCGEVRLPVESASASVPLLGGRFVVLGRRPVAPSGQDKTALLVRLSNQPGQLMRLLEPLAKHDINVHCTELPMPTSTAGGVFFVELDGHRDAAAVRDALWELDTATRAVPLSVQLLGSYPTRVL